MASVMLMGLVINNAIRRSNIRSKKTNEAFWEHERSSYKAPSRPTDDLEYVSFPPGLPIGIPVDDPSLEECQRILKTLSGERIINLSGITNTDIRMSYGKENLPELSKADARYTTLLRSLNTLASGYLGLNYGNEAKVLLEFALSIGSDIKESWINLGRCYLKEDDFDSLSSLRSRADASEQPSLKSVEKELAEMIKLSEIVKAPSSSRS